MAGHIHFETPTVADGNRFALRLQPGDQGTGRSSGDREAGIGVG